MDDESHHPATISDNKYCWDFQKNKDDNISDPNAMIMSDRFSGF